MKNKITIFVVLIVALFALIFNYVKASGGIEYLNFLSGLTSSVLTKGYLIVGDDAGLSQATSSIFISSIGSVGISTTSPWGLLSVNPSGISSPAFTVGSSTKTDFVITNAGNVGIGTTTPNNLIQIKDLIEFNNTNYSTKLGYQAGYSLLSDSAYPNNTAIGYWSLRSNTTGIGNSALGKESLYSNIDGANNSAFGYDSLHFNTSGSYNMAIGFQSLYSNTSGDYNTAVGEASSRSNTDGSRNSALGNESLYFNTSGSHNIAIGGDSLYSNIGGNRNSALGFQSLFYNQSATNTVAIGYSAAQGTANYNNQGGVYLGYQAGYSAGTGSNYNTLLGYQAGYGITTGTYNIIIGQNVEAPSITGNQQLNIGNLIYGTNIYNDATVSSVPIIGNVGIGTTSPGTLFSLGNTGDNTINISATATSTFGSGLNLRTGCFAINGTCVGGGGGGGGSGTVNSGVADGVAYYKAADTNVYGTSTLTILPSGLFGVGTTTPGSLLSLNNIANFTAATSTFYGNGINLEDGCFAINGTCVGGGGGGSGANTALSNLASVAINTSLISDIDSTDDLGSSAIYWANTYTDKIFLNTNSLLDGATDRFVDVGSGLAGQGIKITSSNTGLSSYFHDTYTLVMGFGMYYKGSTASWTREGSGNRFYLNVSTSGVAMKEWTSAGAHVDLINATDAEVVFAKLLTPTSDSVYDLGKTDRYWLNTYTDKLFLNSTATLDGATAGVISIVGKVGIGTTTPGATLAVQGDALADNWLTYSPMSDKINATNEIKNIKCQAGTSKNGWCDIDHASLPVGVRVISPHKISEIVGYKTLAIGEWSEVIRATTTEERTDPIYQEREVIGDYMSVNKLTTMLVQSTQELNTRISNLEAVKIGGMINSQGEFISEAIKKEIDARIDAKKDELKNYVLQAIQAMSFKEKIKLLF